MVEVVGDRGPKAPLEYFGFCVARCRAVACRPLPHPLAKRLQRAVRARQSLRAEVELGPVLRLQNEITERKRIEPLVDQLGDAEEVARRLRHPRTREHQQPSVHPVAHDSVAGEALRLRQLSLVMRKDVVRTACVDVEALAQKRDRHRGAFDVPAREAWTPRARPHLHSMLACRLPKSEVAWMPLAWIDLAPRSGQQLFGAVS